MSNEKPNRTMRDVNHTAPVREVNDLFARGPRPMTDGGRRGSHGGRQRMKDVSHTPPTGDREVDRVFARGNERMASDAGDRAVFARGNERLASDETRETDEEDGSERTETNQ